MQCRTLHQDNMVNGITVTRIISPTRTLHQGHMAGLTLGACYIRRVIFCGKQLVT